MKQTAESNYTQNADWLKSSDQVKGQLIKY